jgi:hypothetical protein
MDMRTFKNPKTPSFSKRDLVSKISSSKENDRPDRQAVMFRAKFLLSIGPFLG